MTVLEPKDELDEVKFVLKYVYCTCPVIGWLSRAFNAHIFVRTCPDGS